MADAPSPSHDGSSPGQQTAVTAYIGLGANLGEAQQTLQHALAGLDAMAGISLLSTAPFYRTAPLEASGPDYLNTVACIRTTLSPWELLDVMQELENRHGRERPYRNAPRTLDLDLLLYGDANIADERLTVPHPRMHERAFVLYPLAEIAGGRPVPGLGSVAELAARCDGRALQRLAPPPALND